MRQILAMFLIGLAGNLITAAEPLSTEQRRERLLTIRAMVQTFDAQVGEDASLKPLTLAAQPSLLYADNERDLSDASLWGWEAEGKLLALSAVELRPREGTGGVWSFECASLSPQRVRVTLPTGAWTFEKDAVQERNLPNAPLPAATRGQRLLQLRKMSERFTAACENPNQGRIELRRLASPVYRQAENIAGDSALFAFANGTNPEVLVLIATDGATTPWTYRLASLSGDGAQVQLDEQEVWRVERFTGPNSRPTYINGKLKTLPKP